MAATQLKVKNVTAGDLTVPLDDGTAVVLHAGVETSLDRAALLSAGLRAQARSGNVVFVEPTAPTAAERELGADVAHALLFSLGNDVQLAAQSIAQGKIALAGKRDRYNDAWLQTTTAIAAGNALSKGGAALLDLASFYLNDEAATDAVGAAQQAIDDLDADFVASGATDATKLAAYNSARNQLEEKLREAKDALAAKDAALAADEALVQAISDAVNTLKTAKPTDVGSKLTWT